MTPGRGIAGAVRIVTVAVVVLTPQCSTAVAAHASPAAEGAVPCPFLDGAVLPQALPDPTAFELRGDKPLVPENPELFETCLAVLPDGLLYAVRSRADITDAEVASLRSSFMHVETGGDLRSRPLPSARVLRN